VKPYVQIGFMPQALSASRALPARLEAGRPVRQDLHRLGLPSRDYAKWAELVYQWTRHCVEKYGARGGRELVLEVWNDRHPLLAGDSGSTTSSTILRLTPCAALPTARVGGPRAPAPAAKERQVSPRLPRALPARDQLRHAKRARRSISSLSTPRAGRDSWKHVEMASPTSSRTPRGFEIVASTRASRQAARDRESDRMAAPPAPHMFTAERLSQQRPVRELHSRILARKHCLPESTASL